MKELEKIIREKGIVLDNDILKVGSFLNNNIDIKLYKKIGKEFYNHFKDKEINKILTIEASGIALATVTAINFNCDFVFAKKSKSSNVSGDCYIAESFSYTHNVKNTVIVPKEYLKSSDRVLIIDDFLATGSALEGLIDIVKKANATLVGIGIAIEKGYQGGGDKLRNSGIDVYSLANIEKMNKKEIVFKK